MTTEDLLNYYYKKDVISLDPKGYTKKFEPDQLLGMRVTRDVKDPKSGEVIAREGRKFNKAIVRQLEAAKVNEIPIALEEIVGRISAHDIIDSNTGEVLLADQRGADRGDASRSSRSTGSRRSKCSSPRSSPAAGRCG